MIGNDTKVDKLEAHRIILEMAAAGGKASKKALRNLAKMQSAMIRDGVKPSGAQQTQNIPGVTRRKKGKPPLWDTGRLMNPKTWRLKEDKGEGTVTIRPPKDREGPIAILYALHQYETVFHRIPDEWEEETQALLDAEMKKVKT